MWFIVILSFMSFSLALLSAWAWRKEKRGLSFAAGVGTLMFTLLLIDVVQLYIK